MRSSVIRRLSPLTSAISHQRQCASFDSTRLRAEATFDLKLTEGGALGPREPKSSVSKRRAPIGSQTQLPSRRAREA